MDPNQPPSGNGYQQHPGGYGGGSYEQMPPGLGQNGAQGFNGHPGYGYPMGAMPPSGMPGGGMMGGGMMGGGMSGMGGRGELVTVLSPKSFARSPLLHPGYLTQGVYLRLRPCAPARWARRIRWEEA